MDWILGLLLIGAAGGIGSVLRALLAKLDGWLPYGLFLANSLAAGLVAWLLLGPQLSEALQAQQVPQGAADEIEFAAGEAFTDGAKWAAFAAALFLLLGFASTFNLRSRVRKD